VANVEWKLIEMPLPRLQQIGDGDDVDEFVYRIAWSRAITVARVRAGDFDNTIRFIGDAGEHLRTLSGVLRPLIQRQWSAMVARINRQVSEEARLDEYLFGLSRIDLSPVRLPLAAQQENKCFYCDRQIAGIPEVDHFIPWARHPDNGIHNLVAADRRCNNTKRSFLAANRHLGKWMMRFNNSGLRTQLSELADANNWEAHPARTLSVARSIYLQLPVDTRLWLGPGQFVPAAPARLRRALAAV
jgi:5-methylcytosine-specific restriction endonuclease McrA